ncbi:MAG: DUF4302 domain-containing protein [Prevotella sp.]|nr:DUF4302 domain-containing protein [Prevotella sp.]
MKKIYFFLSALCLTMAVASCSLKEDDDFDVTASMRSESNIQDVHKLLQTAKNGWLMEYYGNLNLGGYNVMVKFENDTQATFGSEKWGPNHYAGIDTEGKCITSTSHYKMEQSMGTILSFDGFNETFHYFSMPNNPDYTYNTADGLTGDFEFRVMRADADTIILRGKKHNNRIVMTPIPEDKTWESIINEAKETEEYMTSRSYTLSGADRKDTVEINVVNNGNYRCLIFSYKDSLNMTQTVAAPYIVNADGYKFYSAVEVDGMELDGLMRGTTDDYFIFANNQNLQLDTYTPSLAEALETGTWYFRHGSLGEVAQPKWDAMMEILKTAGRNKKEIKIYTATIGLNSSNKKSVSMSTTSDAPYWGFDQKVLDEAGTRVTLASNSKERNTAGKTYYNSYGWKDVLNTMYGHTFDLSCDYQRRPSYITLTDVNDPNNVITVYATPMYFMEDQSYYQDN